jgi:hypothetical protein
LKARILLPVFGDQVRCRLRFRSEAGVQVDLHSQVDGPLGLPDGDGELAQISSAS